MFPLWKDKIIRMIEYTRGMYRYPDQLLGRNYNLDHVAGQTDILVFAAHPDDDILGLGTVLYRHSLAGSKIKVVFTTNGSSYSFKANYGNAEAVSGVRYEEAVQALSLIGLTKSDVIGLGYPDRGTHRYLRCMAEDIYRLISILKPQKIYVHAIEGGHPDHDVTSFTVQSICKQIRFHKVYEWAEYNKFHPLGSPNITFLPTKYMQRNRIELIRINEHERILKGRMLACHKSQNVVGYFNHGEAIRQSSLSHLEAALYNHWLLPEELLGPAIQACRAFLQDIGERREEGSKIPVKV